MPSVPFNFAGLPGEFSSYERSAVVILPVPFDKTSTWLKGADKGPRAIIDASRNLELYDIETASEVYKKGIFTAKPLRVADSVKMVDKVCSSVRRFLNEGKFVVCLGGEHSVSLGAVKAYAGVAEELSVLHLDAHTDRRDSYDGNPLSHACVMRRISEITPHIVSVGIRSMDSTEIGQVDLRNVFYAGDIHESAGWIPKVCSRLSKRVYITIDLDVFDPGIMPSTGTPEPGGLGWYQVIRLLKAVSVKKEIVGFDVVELCPSENRAPDFLAAKLIYKLLSYKFI